MRPRFELTLADLHRTIMENDHEKFTEIVQLERKVFNRLNVESEGSLTRSAILQCRKEIFDYLVRLQTSVHLTLVLRSIDFSVDLDLYFIYTLIDRGASLDALRFTNFPGSHITDVEVIKSFLDRGLDPNFDNKDGSLLWLVLNQWNLNNKSVIDEIVAMLLYYGLDPFKAFRYWVWTNTGFDLVCVKKCSDFILEQFFLYTFDDGCRSGKMQLTNFLYFFNSKEDVASDVNTFVWNKLLDYDLDFVLDEDSGVRLMENLIFMDMNCFEMLAERCPKAVRYVLEEGEFYSSLFEECCDDFMDKMEYLVVKNDFYFNCVVNFCERLKADEVAYEVICVLDDEDSVTRILLFMIAYGLKCTTQLFHTIFITFGDCALFRTLLHLDMEEYWVDATQKSVMASFITNIHLNVQLFVNSIGPKHWIPTQLFYRTTNGYEPSGETPALRSPFGCLTIYETCDLLDFCVHPKLIELLLNTGNLPERIYQKIQSLPKIPSLQELARESARKHLVSRFGIRSTNEFYCLLNALPIGVIHRKIIAYQRKLYNYTMN